MLGVWWPKDSLPLVGAPDVIISLSRAVARSYTIYGFLMPNFFILERSVLEFILRALAAPVHP